MLVLGHRACVCQLVDRPGDVAGVEALVDARVDLEVAVAGDGRQVKRVARSEHHLRLGLAERAQAQSVGQVRVEPTKLAALDALAREQQVHADGAADAADLQEEVDEVGLGGEQLAELVDDHKQVRHGRQLGSGSAQLAVVRDGRRGVGGLEQLLPPHDLPWSEALARAVSCGSSARLSMRPARCGRPSNGANAAPPL